MKLRNWMEEAIGKQIAWVNEVGRKGGRRIYCITYMDGEKSLFPLSEFNPEEWEVLKSERKGGRHGKESNRTATAVR